MADDWRTKTDAEIIDLMGAAKAQMDKLAALRAKMQAELLNRGFTGGCGDWFKGTYIKSYAQWKLDRAALEQKYGESALRPFMQHHMVSACIKIEPRTDAAARMVAAFAAESVEPVA